MGVRSRCHLLIMCDEYYGGTLGSRECQELLQYGRGVGAIERAGGLVGEHNGRLMDQRTGDGNSLILSSGHLRGPTPPQIR
ncbi:hypothetical protein ABB07_25850 [Streptomyces incarnatus]|uniref:Uncharacterized protein n=1 Tax=Streptomyces incarnatus TaxID=665007 RepID=A0ABN4GI14_9ACTN|nr:hypothetical protein ABB07_25850 [Streptomyces incarnatus]